MRDKYDDASHIPDYVPVSFRIVLESDATRSSVFNDVEGPLAVETNLATRAALVDETADSSSSTHLLAFFDFQADLSVPFVSTPGWTPSKK